MGQKTKIEWCDFTFSPWRGCQKVSPGCTSCYAETMSHRNPKVLGEWGPEGVRAIAAEAAATAELYEAAKGDPRYKDKIIYCGRPRVFCASLADVFEDRPELVGPRQRLFHLIGRTHNLDWLLLTKRPENVERFGVEQQLWYPQDGLPRNVWAGVSVEDQQRADERRELLRATPAAVRFVSYEPALGAVDWAGWEFVDWIISGGESGAKARPSHPQWHRATRNFCQANGIAYFFKQWGEWEQALNYHVDTIGATCWLTPGNEKVDPFANGSVLMGRVGKKAAGRLLDGRVWEEFPVKVNHDAVG